MSRILINTKNLSREDWLRYRKSSIGGSEAATIVGLNPYSSQYTLWADKNNLIEPKEDTEVMRQGRDLEDYVAKRWEEATGKKVKRRNFMFLHDDYDFISANVDREIIGENAGLECKTTSIFNKHDFESGEIPLYYYCQCMHYMAVMGYEKMYLAVLVFSKGFYHFEIERNEEEIQNLLKAEIEWWNKYIVSDDVPFADGSDSTENTLKELYPNSNGNAISINNKTDDARKLFEIKENIKELKKIKKELEQSIQQEMQDNEKAKIEEFVVEWKNQERKNIDSKKLKQELPEVYKKYIKTSHLRVFKIKEAK